MKKLTELAELGIAILVQFLPTMSLSLVSIGILRILIKWEEFIDYVDFNADIVAR